MQQEDYPFVKTFSIWDISSAKAAPDMDSSHINPWRIGVACEVLAHL
jgi:hypothetical protein